MPEKSKVNRFQTLGLGLREDESAEHSSSSFLRKVQEIAIIGAAAALAACGGGSSGTTSPPPIEYTVSATASPTAGGTIQGAGTYQQGEQATLTEKPNAGYSFEGWSGPGYTGTSPTASFMVNGNETEIATFQQQTFTLSVTANPSNDGTVTGNGTYDYGQTETITATPASGYTFAGWSCSGAGCYDGSNATATVTMDANIQETANFQAVTYAVNVTASPSNEGTVTGSGSFSQGQNVTLSATANQGFTFSNWSAPSTEPGCYSGTNPNPTFVMPGNTCDQTANFNVATTQIFYTQTYQNPPNPPSYTNVIIGNKLVTQLSPSDIPSTIIVDNGNDTVYEAGGGAIEEIDPTTNTIKKTIQDSEDPDTLTLSHDGTKIYMTGPLSQAPQLLNTSTDQIAELQTLPFWATGTILSSDDRYVAFANGNVHDVNSAGIQIGVLDNSTGNLTTLTVPDITAGTLTFSPDNSQLWVTTETGLFVYDMADLNAAPKAINIQNEGINIKSGSRVLFVNGKAYVGFRNQIINNNSLELTPSYVYEIDPTTLQVINKFPEGLTPDFVVLGPDNNLYVPNVSISNDNTVVTLDRINPVNGNVTSLVLDTFTGVDVGPDGVSPISGFQNAVFSTDGTKLYTAGGGGNTLPTQCTANIIDLGSFSVVSRITLPGYSGFETLSWLNEFGDATITVNN